MPFPTGWSYYKVGTIDHNYVGSTLTDFALLVRKASDSDVLAHALSNGNDIRFSSDSGSPTEYPFGHVGSFSAGNLLEYVKVPSISAVVDTTLRGWYGNAGASDGQQKSSVPDSNTKLFMPLEENPAGSAPQYSDWTSNANNGTVVQRGSGNITQGTGEVGVGADFSTGFEVGIDCGATSIPGHANNKTLSIWCKLTSLGTYPAFLWSADSGLTVFGGNTFQFNNENGTAAGASFASSGFSLNAWHQLVGTYDGTDSKLYLDGTLQATNNGVSGTYSVPTTAALVGEGHSYESPVGILDEATIANAARTVDWISFDYQNKFNNRVSWGSELAPGGGTTSVSDSDGLDVAFSSDAGTVSASETSSDGLDAAIGDARAVSARESSSDGLDVAIAETPSFLTSTSSGDGLDAAIVETTITMSPASGSDGLDAAIVETTSAHVGAFASDGLDVSFVESTLTSAHALASDGLDAAIVDAGALVGAEVPAVGLLQQICDDTWSYAARTLRPNGALPSPGSLLQEICNAVWAHATRTLTGSVVFVSAADSASVALGEATSFGVIAVTSVDSLGVVYVEVGYLPGLGVDLITADVMILR
jgi:hypothetical protein